MSELASLVPSRQSEPWYDSTVLSFALKCLARLRVWPMAGKPTVGSFASVLSAAIVLFFALLAPAFVPLPAGAAPAADRKTEIQADSLDYEKETATYVAKGKVVIQSGVATITADEVTYNEDSGETIAIGSVHYEEPTITISAKRAELNLELKTGKLFDATVFIKKDNFHIAGKEIERITEDEYLLKDASFTTCDAPFPAWCFRGEDVDVVIGDRLKAKNITFRVKDTPVFYSPYLSTALGRERKTGLLIPNAGYIKSKGFHYEQPFFIALAENRDATVTLDYYKKRGLGTGLEYRFVEPDLSRGNVSVYHIDDRSFDRHFWELRGLYENRDADRALTGFLALNYINSQTFYSEYYTSLLNKYGATFDTASFLSATTERFLESTGEVSLKLDNARLYLAGRYFVDLKAGVTSGSVLHTLPEFGYTMHPRPVGPLVFSLLSSVSYFTRNEGAQGLRLDIYPKISHSMGGDVVLSQSLGLRETAYSLSQQGALDQAPHRESFDYRALVHTRLTKSYGSFTHIIEPSVGVSFIPAAGPELPSFDSVELYKRTAAATASVLNRFRDSSGEFLTLRLSQPYDAYQNDHHLEPFALEVAVKRPLSLRAEVTYDYGKTRVGTANADLGIPAFGGTFSVGERYEKDENILAFTVGSSHHITKELLAESGFYIDARNGGVRYLMGKLKYQKQCWGVTAVMSKRQNDYAFSVFFDLLGLGTVRF